MIPEFVGLVLDVQTLKNAFGRAIKVGAVEQIDAEKGYRLRLGGTDDQPFLSPWYPHPESSKTSVPLKKGQIVGLINPTGDPRQGIMIRGGYSGDLPSPNADMEANVFEDAGVKVSIANGKLTIAIGGVSFEFSGDGYKQTGGNHSHDGKNTGKDHRHGGIVHGGEDTDVPNGV